MTAGTAVALKEWAAIEDALASGRLSVLVRKGGIHERRDGFDVEHRAFWIYPTGWHQNEHELSPAFREHLGETPRFAPGEIPLRVHCVVEDAIRVEDLDAVQRLAELQPFSGATLAARFAYRGKPYLHVLIVRAHVLPEPRVIPNTAAYDGCVSWVALDEPVSPVGAVFALSDEQFAALRSDVLARLGVSPAERRSEIDIDRIDLSALREMWRQRPDAAAEFRKRVDPTGMTRPPRDPDEAAFLKERGLEGPFVEVERPGWREYARRKWGSPDDDGGETSD